MATRVYQYGLCAPVENEALIRAQIRNAHVYRNTLTEIERGRRAAVRGAMSAFGDIAALEVAARNAVELEEKAVAALKAHRSANRDRSESPEMRAAVKAAREAKKAAQKALSECRKAHRSDPALAAEIERINGLATDLIKSARAHSGVYWGTYLGVEAAMQAARAAPLFDGIQPSDPAFLRWRGDAKRSDGHIGVQLQNGLSVTALFGDDTRVRVAPVDEKAWHSTVRAERRRMSRTKLSMRIGSDGRAPVWGVWPMIMHRQLPKDAVLKWVTVTCKNEYPHEHWTVEFTIELPENMPRTCGDGAVAVDLGWRLMDDESIRVARWRGTDNKAGELRLSKHLLEGLRLPEGLRAVRDKHFNAERAALMEWLRPRVDDPNSGLPVWLLDAARTLPLWRSSSRLARLQMRWEKERFTGDEERFEAFRAWRKKEHHLAMWEDNQRQQAHWRRREEYRVFAAGLAKAYGTIVLEQFDLRAFARRPSVTADAVNETARSNRHLVAVSELRLVLVNAFTTRGGKEARLPAENTTRECNVCHNVATFDAATNVEHTCANCGTLWDQDDNACVNLLERYSKLPPPETEAAKPQKKWSKVRQKRAEKEAARPAAPPAPAGAGT